MDEWNLTKLAHIESQMNILSHTVSISSCTETEIRRVAKIRWNEHKNNYLDHWILCHAKYNIAYIAKEKTDF